jgi:hypothetical protein
VRVTLDIKSEGGQHSLVVSGPDGPWPDRPVTWLPGKLLVARDAASAVDQPDRLAQAVECCDTGGDMQKQKEQLGQLERYGALLFEAAFGSDLWQKILATVGADYLEIAVRAAADDNHAALQALRWEALHDGTGFVAAQGAVYGGRNIPVGVVRVIASSGPVSGNAVPGGEAFREITHIPKLLFAVGSHLTDRDVRAGAEFMGIMRRLDRGGGSIRARVLERATRPELVAELAKFKPDVLHLIGHGRRRPDGQVEVQLRGDSGGTHYAPAEELLSAFAEVGHWPVMVVLSACQTAAAGGGLGGNLDRVSPLPFAARLVAGTSASRGVPVVVAMAGDISDTACRVFTQALTTAIGHGVPLGKAVIRGRRAAFYKGAGPDADRPAPDSGHWVMPAVFLASHVPDGACLVNTERADAAKLRVNQLGLAVEPVFYGRGSFLTALDRLLDGDDPLNVLVAHASNPAQNFGGTRLLQELGAHAVRSDVLPVLLGDFDFDNDQNRDRKGLIDAFKERIDEIRFNLLDLDERDSQAVAAAKAGAKGANLARKIRNDLKQLVDDLDPDDPVRQRAERQPQTILLCRRVDEWLDALDDFLDLLGPPGLHGGTTSVPVVLTGAGPHLLSKARERGWTDGEADRTGWIHFEELKRFSAPDEEDILAYQWWLLNPPAQLSGDQRAFAPRRGVPDDWKNILRTVLDAIGPVYHDVIYRLAADQPTFYASGIDDALLASYAKVLP